MKILRAPFLALALILCAFPSLAGTLPMMGAGPGAISAGGGSPPTWNWVNGNSIGSGGTSVTTNSTGHSIASGDLLVVVAGPQDDAGTSLTGFTCPAGFTSITVSTGTNSFQEVSFSKTLTTKACYKVAGGAETGAYTVSWTGTNDRYVGWVLADIATGTYNATPIDDAGVTGNNGYPNSWDAPSVTTTKANDLLISVYYLFAGDATDPVTKTAGMTSRLSTFDASFEGEFLVLTSTPGSGATGVRNVTTATGVSELGLSWNIAIKGL